MTIAVLVVDDERALRDVLVDVLARDARVECVGTAADGAEAVEVARATRPNVALVDVKMPSGGARAVRALIECSPGTRVIAFSAYGDSGIVRDLFDAGATGYVLKGTPAGQIVDAIVRCADGHAVVSPEILASADDLDARWTDGSRA